MDISVRTGLKIAGRWLLTIALFSLLYMGATDLLSMAVHIHHNDQQLPQALAMVLYSVVLPAGVGYLIAFCVRNQLLGSVLPLLVGPFLLLVLTGYLRDSFYPPYRDELLVLLGSGAIQGVSATAGYLLCRRLTARGHSVSAAP